MNEIKVWKRKAYGLVSIFDESFPIIFATKQGAEEQRSVMNYPNNFKVIPVLITPLLTHNSPK